MTLGEITNRDCDNCSNRGDASKCELAKGHAHDSNSVLTCELLYPSKFTRLCITCSPHTKAVCKQVFKRLWIDKSWGGIGCRSPIDDYVQKWHPETQPPPPME